MARIAGVNVPDNKRIATALTYIYGIGNVLAKRILAETKVNPAKKTVELTAQEIGILKDYIESKYRTEGDLKRDKMTNIKRLKDIGCWRGMRHAKGLPTRGQRTKTNNRTVRGNVRKTVGSGRKPSATPT
ncbi:MAG: 30S ribosomal protein S13 [Candidatus Paceibacterota bacterium]|jgi:small subunit ribosomal protein S13